MDCLKGGAEVGDCWLAVGIVKSSKRSSAVSDLAIRAVVGLSRCTMTDVVLLLTDDSMVVQLNSVGQGSKNVTDLTKQPFQMRVLWDEILHKHWISNLKTSLFGTIIMTLFLRYLLLLNLLGQIRSHDA